MADRGLDVVILAAGCGRRMGIAEHKALVPAVAGQGTLERLLGQLQALPVHQVAVVTGHRREAVEATVSRCLPQAQCVHNPHFETTEILQSLACAFLGRPCQRECWVLMADTVYSEAALTALFSAPPGGVGLAVTACMGPSEEIAVEIRGGAVVALGRYAARADGRMAHAVRWPPGLQARLCAAAAAGLRFQWELIADLLRERPFAAIAAHAIMLPRDGACDLDTAADLMKARSIVLP